MKYDNVKIQSKQKYEILMFLKRIPEVRSSYFTYLEFFWVLFKVLLGKNLFFFLALFVRFGIFLRRLLHHKLLHDLDLVLKLFFLLLHKFFNLQQDLLVSLRQFKDVGDFEFFDDVSPLFLLFLVFFGIFSIIEFASFDHWSAIERGLHRSLHWANWLFLLDLFEGHSSSVFKRRTLWPLWHILPHMLVDLFLFRRLLRNQSILVETDFNSFLFEALYENHELLVEKVCIFAERKDRLGGWRSLFVFIFKFLLTLLVQIAVDTD